MAAAARWLRITQQPVHGIFFWTNPKKSKKFQKIGTFKPTTIFHF
jgi:hypothetical protein